MSNNHYLDPYFRQYCCFHKVKQGLFVINLRFICNYLLRITLTGIEGVDQQKCYIFAEYIKFDRTDYNSYLNNCMSLRVHSQIWHQTDITNALFEVFCYLNWWLWCLAFLAVLILRIFWGDILLVLSFVVLFFFFRFDAFDMIWPLNTG